LSTESAGSRRELVANCVHTADADATKQFRRVGGVYWALACTIQHGTMKSAIILLSIIMYMYTAQLGLCVHMVPNGPKCTVGSAGSRIKKHFLGKGLCSLPEGRGTPSTAIRSCE